MPSKANPTPTEPRISDFQAASIASLVRVNPMSRAAVIVVASMATHTSPRLSVTGTAVSAAMNHSSRQ